jgi:hypothetical protein
VCPVGSLFYAPFGCLLTMNQGTDDACLCYCKWTLALKLPGVKKTSENLGGVGGGTSGGISCSPATATSSPRRLSLFLCDYIHKSLTPSLTVSIPYRHQSITKQSFAPYNFCLLVSSNIDTIINSLTPFAACRYVDSLTYCLLNCTLSACEILGDHYIHKSFICKLFCSYIPRGFLTISRDFFYAGSMRRNHFLRSRRYLLKISATILGLILSTSRWYMIQNQS